MFFRSKNTLKQNFAKTPISRRGRACTLSYLCSQSLESGLLRLGEIACMHRVAKKMSSKDLRKGSKMFVLRACHAASSLFLDSQSLGGANVQ